MIVVMEDRVARRVRSNRMRMPWQAILATQFRDYTIDDDVLCAMPRGIGDEVEVVFFLPDHCMSIDKLENEYRSRDLVPADPYSLAGINEADLHFSFDYPNSTYWKDRSGKWCQATFAGWSVRIIYIDSEVSDTMWCAGIVANTPESA